jgi:hypothetical protein
VRVRPSHGMRPEADTTARYRGALLGLAARDHPRRYKIVRLLYEPMPMAATARKSGVSFEIRLLYLCEDSNDGHLWPRSRSFTARRASSTHQRKALSFDRREAVAMVAAAISPPRKLDRRPCRLLIGRGRMMLWVLRARLILP